MGLNAFFWFGLVGWVAGWVTGKSLKCESHSPWIDAFVGLVGGLTTGFAVQSLEKMNNWGFLMVVFVAAVGSALLTWVAHRIKDAVQHKHTAH